MVDAYNWLAKNPNRVALYLTALADVLAVVLVLAADLQLEEVGAVVTAVAAINAKVLSWLKGWQQTEKAVYQQRLVNSQLDREAELVAQAGRPANKPRVNLPR